MLHRPHKKIIIKMISISQNLSTPVSQNSCLKTPLFGSIEVSIGIDFFQTNMGSKINNLGDII